MELLIFPLYLLSAKQLYCFYFNVINCQRLVDPSPIGPEDVHLWWPRQSGEPQQKLFFWQEYCYTINPAPQCCFLHKRRLQSTDSELPIGTNNRKLFRVRRLPSWAWSGGTDQDQHTILAEAMQYSTRMYVITSDKEDPSTIIGTGKREGLESSSYDYYNRKDADVTKQ
jgi:hypothetical protein